jgi:ubiquinone/menaquinone biosynthesis C-methylase UbiE
VNARATVPTWWPNEMVNPHPYLTSEDIGRYDLKANFSPTEDVEFLRSLGLDALKTVVDLGSGTGKFAFEVAPFCKTVMAVDVSDAMNEVVWENAQKHGFENVFSVHAGLLSFQILAESVDFIYCRNTLHHVSDLWKVAALTRMYEMLKPNGFLRLRDIAFSVEPQQFIPALEHWFSNAPEDSNIGWTRQELEHEVKEEFFTYTWLLEVMLERVGFVIQEREYSPNGMFAMYVCRK